MRQTSKTLKPGAGDESRTRDLNLGKVALYQLSYSRIDFFPGGAKRSRTALDGFAIRCITDLLSRRCRLTDRRGKPEPSILTKKGSASFPFSKTWSGKRDSNSRPQPWQGCALPTELFPQIPFDLRRRSAIVSGLLHGVNRNFHVT